MHRWFAVALSVMGISCGFTNRSPNDDVRRRVSSGSVELTSPGLRLPRDFSIERYDVALTVVPTRPTMTGSVQITGRLLRQTSVIWLHAEDMTFGTARFVAGSSEVPLEVVSGTSRGRIALRSLDPLPLGPATISIDYTANVSSTESAGTFRQQSGEDWYVFTHHEPLAARRSVPCLDEPDVKVPWRVRLTIPASATAVSNSPAEFDVVAGAVRNVTFAPTKPIPSYLLAYAVGRFEYVDAGKSAYGVPIRIVTMRGRAADAAWAAESTPKILSAMERWFGTPYPFAKLDSIAMPMSNFGAMENPGLITYREKLLLMPATAAEKRREAYVAVAAHELAHQWFGNLVTPVWWDDLWLSESFASWLPEKVLAELYPSWVHAEDAVVERNDALVSDGLGTARAIRQPIVSEGDVVTAFDGITYDKGASVLRMLEDWIGPERFQIGVRAYLARHARGNATADDFIAAIAAQAAEIPVQAAFAGLLDQTGAPRLTLRTQCSKGKGRLIIAQGRFLPLGATEGSSPRWHLPVCVQAGLGGKVTRACTVLTGADGSIDLPRCPAWVWPNAGGRGYYRSSLDEAGWQALRTRGWKRLTGPERLSAAQDLVAAVASGDVGVDVALDLVSVLIDPKEPNLVHLAVEIVERVDAWIPDERRSTFAKWIVKKFGPLARKLSEKSKVPDTAERERLRSAVLLLVADLGGDQALRATAVAKAAEWKALPEAIRGDMLAIAVRTQPGLGDALIAAFKSEPDRILRGEIARALGSVPDPVKLEAGLALMLDPAIDIRSTSPILWAAVAGRDTRGIAETFVIAHLDELIARFAGDSALSLLSAMTASCDATKVEPLRALATTKLGDKRGAEREINQSFEWMRQCVAQRAAVSSALAGWLAKLPQR